MTHQKGDCGVSSAAELISGILQHSRHERRQLVALVLLYGQDGRIIQLSLAPLGPLFRRGFVGKGLALLVYNRAVFFQADGDPVTHFARGCLTAGDSCHVEHFWIALGVLVEHRIYKNAEK